jgi:GAF domain-containing protein
MLETAMIGVLDERLAEIGHLISENPQRFLQGILDLAIEVSGANKGTLQRFDEAADCLRIVASRGFTNHGLNFLARDTNTSCAAVLKQRMRVIVSNISTSYLYVGRPELYVLRSLDIAAVHSTPIINCSGRLLGVFSVQFRQPLVESRYDPSPLDDIAAFAAERLDEIEQNSTGKG